NKIQLFFNFQPIKRFFYGLMLAEIFGGCQPFIVTASAQYLDGIAPVIVDKPRSADTQIRLLLHPLNQMSERLLFNDRIIIEQPDIISLSLKRIPDTHIIAAGKAQVFFIFDQMYIRKTLADLLHCLIGGAVIYNDDGIVWIVKFL